MITSSLQPAFLRIHWNRFSLFFSRVFLGFVIFLAMLSVSCKGEVLNIVGSLSVNMPVADAAQILRAEIGMDIHINTNGGSDAGIGALGDSSAQIAMTTRPVTPEDRADSPEVNFKQIYLGQHVVALGVSSDVWDGGVHGLSREQLRAIYEKKINNWKQVGGPDLPIVFFNADEGRGVWEMLIQWIYGSSKRAPLGRFPMMSSNEEARNSLEFTHGSMSLLSPKFIDGKEIFALGVAGSDNKAYFPTLDNVVNGKYPLMKPMFLVVNEKPTGESKTLIDFMFSNRGRALIEKYGYFSLEEIRLVDPEFQPLK